MCLDLVHSAVQAAKLDLSVKPFLCFALPFSLLFFLPVCFVSFRWFLITPNITEIWLQSLKRIKNNGARKIVQSEKTDL